MSNQPPASPLKYEPSIEKPEDDEAGTIHSLLETLQKINEITFKDGGHGLRSVHAKSHGLLTGELQVFDDLPPVLAQGLFAQSGTYPLLMRFSTVPGDLLDDKVSTPRGVAIKLIGVPGERVDGSEGDTTQDFVMVNGPAFGAKDAKHFLSNLKLVAATTDRSESLKIAFSALARGAEKVVEAFGGKSSAIVALGGQPETHILGDTFYSQVPSLYGPYIAKFSIAPVSPELTVLRDAPVDLHDKPDGLRDAVNAHFAQHGGNWELRVQLCTDLEKMPVEDASVAWPEDESPFIPVARISVPSQPAWNEARAAAMDDGLSFNPWHALAAHRPIGSIMRVRKVVYDVMSKVRARQNRVTIAEPTSLPSL
ncbi:catalase family protein [Rhodanobacter sp. L36]|uniref:catalase family protein n=1 Tax=Rhodanobacter sp. L36 TaxID=1747221 RepID=UPI00131B51A9|nr:catalase family protein [Rhodanobacter sp. L36]